MSIPKKYGYSCKDQAFVIASGLSKLSFQSRDDEFLALPKASNKLADLSNPEPSLTSSLILEYIKDNLQQILKTVWKVQTSAHSQDWKISEDSSKQALKSRVSNIYKSKSHRDCYNFI